VRWIAMGTSLVGALDDRAAGDIWISPEEIQRLPMSGPAWKNVFDDAQRSIDTNLGDPASDGDTTAYAKALVYVRTGEEIYRLEVLDAINNVMGTEGGSVRYLGLGLLGYIVAADLVGVPSALDAEFKAYLANVRCDNLGEGRNLIEVHEQRPNNWGTTAGPSRLALALYIDDMADFNRGANVLMGWLDGSWPHDYGDPCWRTGYSPPQGINPVGTVWAGVLPDDQRRGGCPPATPCENYVRSALAGVIAQALIVRRHTGLDPWAHENNAILRAYEWIESTGCGFPGDDEWQPWLVNRIYGSNLATVDSPAHGKSMGYTDWTHGSACVPDDGGSCRVSNGWAWQNFSVPDQSSTFTIEYDAMPAASGINGVTTLSQRAVSSYDENAILVRFNPSRFIDARNGAGYAADVSIPYTGEVSYHFLVEVNVDTHTYSVWVDGVQFADNFDFSTSQSSVSSLGSWAVYNESGSHTVCNWTLNCSPSCLWDLNGDGVVNSLDFLMLLENWDDHGINDILAMIAAWGDC